jgi:hypothetical protein
MAAAGFAQTLLATAVLAAGRSPLRGLPRPVLGSVPGRRRHVPVLEPTRTGRGRAGRRRMLTASPVGSRAARLSPTAESRTPRLFRSEARSGRVGGRFGVGQLPVDSGHLLRRVQGRATVADLGLLGAEIVPAGRCCATHVPGAGEHKGSRPATAYPVRSGPGPDQLYAVRLSGCRVRF